jgi:hypothetical protein
MNWTERDAYIGKPYGSAIKEEALRQPKGQK